MKLGSVFKLLVLGVWLTNLGLAHASDPKALYDRGVGLGAQGKMAEARIALEQALKIDPRLTPVRRCLGLLDDVQARRVKEETAVHLFRAFAYFNAFRTDAAIQELNRAAALDPRYPLTYNHRGDAYADQKKWDLAIADYKRVLQIDPRYAQGYLHRGLAYNQQGKHDQAVADYTRALEINPRYEQALYNRGNSYAQMGRYEQAVADYNRLLEMNPGNGHAYVRKAMAYEKAGRVPEALAAYKSYLQNASAPDPLQVKFVKDKIKSLEKGH